MVTKQDLEWYAARLGEKLGEPLTVEYAYGRTQLYAKNGSQHVSPLLTRAALLEWMEAFDAGIDAARNV